MKSIFFRRFIVILSIIAILAGCGSTGGMNEDSGDDGDDGGTSTPTEPTFNFTGTLYNANGYPFPDVDIYVFSDWSKTTTDSDGSYAMNVSSEMHTLMGSRLGYVERFRLIDTSDGADKDTDIVLHASAVASKTILANTGDTSIISNVYRNHTALLNIPAQSSGKFWNADKEVDSVAISFENINLNGPIPVPLPSASNTDTPLPGGKQTPSVLIAVQPALFKMDTSGTLTFPNPDSLSMDKILRFDPETHQWKTITEISSASIAINRGGIYGLFFDTPKNGSIRGEADPGSLIRVGDETVLVGNDGTFFINEVPVPPEGNVAILALGPADEDTGIRPVIQNDVEVKENEQTLVDLVPVTVGTLTITSSTDTLVCDGETEVLITAEVLDSDGKPLTGEVTVDFTTTSGELSQSSVMTSGGVANVTLMCSGGASGVARVTASSGGVSDTVSINLLSVPKSISLSVSQISVKTDNSDSAIISATVLNSQNAPFADIDVTFSVDSGMISYVDDTEDDTQVKTTIQTDVNGKAQIKFSAGPGTDGKTNRTATVSATVSGLDPVLVPIQVTGTSVELDNDKTNLDIQGETKATLAVTVKDYGLNAIFSAPVQFSVEPEGALSWAATEEKYAEFTTDLTGKLVVTITGESVAEEAVLTVSSLGDQKTLTYKVTSTDLLFSIISPEEDPFSVNTNTELPVIVQAPFQDKVRFSTSFGKWENGEKVIDVDVVNKKATATLSSALAGIASVQVFDVDDPGTSDSLRVAIAAPSSEANNISLQTNTSVVAPSTGDTQNTVTLRATVKNANSQVVSNSPVLFSLSNTTGGGEYISPVIVYTNAQGIATSTFYSGSLTSGAEGVLVTAEVVGMSNVTPSTRPIIIGGTAGSVVISVSTVVETDDDETTYTLPGTVMVADANGNPVSGAQVTLGTWPITYFTGIWVESEGTCVPFYYDENIENEDVNRNLIMEPDEDTNGDGELTPPNSAAGVIRVYEWDEDVADDDGVAIGTTNETGTVKFDLTYPKTSAAWIRDELTAKVLVAGTETQSTYNFVLVPSTTDTAPPCPLQDSPYNSSAVTPEGSINLLTDKETLTANGQSQATVSAVIYDFNGLPGPSDVTVTFTITSGGGGFPQETIVSASTSSNGKASVSYTAPKGGSGVVTIEATAEGYGTVQKGLITLDQGKISITSRGAHAMLYDGADNPGIPVMIADGTSLLTLTAQLTNSDGSQMVTTEEESVNWTLTPITTGIENIGGLGGSPGNLQLSTFTVSAVTSTEYVTGLLSSGEDPVEVKVTATLNSTGATDEITVILERDTVGNIVLSLEPETQKTVGGTPVTIKAVVTDKAGNTVKRGEKITFDTDDIGVFLISGQLEKPVTVETQQDDGVIILQLLVTDAEVKDDNTATVRASSLSGSAEGVLNLTFSINPAEREPNRIEVHPDYPKPATIDVLGGPTGRTQSEIRFLVYDENGELVTGSYTINFEINDNRPNGGEALTSTEGKTNGNGEAFTILKTGLRPGVVYVKATYIKENDDGTTTLIESVGNAIVQIQGGMPAAEYFRLIDGEWANGEKEFTANVRDIFGDPVPDDLAVKFDTTNGYVNPSQDLTSEGTVETVLYDPSTSATDYYTVTAETDGAYTTKVSALAVLYRESNSPVIYAGTTGSGVYKSTDSGSNWSNISGLSTGSATDSQKNIDPYINDVAVDPDNISLIFAGGGYTGKGKIASDCNNLFISRDGGSSWAYDATGLPTDGNIPVQSVYCEAGGAYVWVGTQSKGIYFSTDEGKTFTAAGPAALVGSLRINDIIHVTGNGASALLYAATDNGVFKSYNGGSTWALSGSITDVVKVLGFYRKINSEANSIVYAGTEDSGILYSDSAGENWKPMPETGRLLVVGDPKPGDDNQGTGGFVEVDYDNDGQTEYVNVLSGAKTETWTVICKQAVQDGGVFRVIGSSSGEQPDYDITTGKYDKLPGILEFTITAGETDFAVGDYFTFDVVKDDAKTITNLLVDEGNNRLYAVTLLESFIHDNSYYHDIGSVYYFKLGPNGSVEPGNWTLAIDGLPEFDASETASNDDTIIPQYALALIPGDYSPIAIMIGGEKVTVYKASSGLITGTPTWQSSMSGIKNRIMTRLIAGGDTAEP